MVNEGPARRHQAPAGGAGQAMLQIQRQDWRADPKKLAGSPANSPSGARSLIGSLRQKPVRLQASAPICARSRESGPVCARPNCLTGPIVSWPRAGSATGLAGLASRARARHRASSAIGGAYRRDIRSARGESDLAARIDNRNSAAFSRARGRAAALRSLRAEGTLLRGSELSGLTHSSSLRPRPSWRAY